MTKMLRIMSFKKYIYLLFLKIRTQKQPAIKNKKDIIRYKAGSGVSPAER